MREKILEAKKKLRKTRFLSPIWLKMTAKWAKKVSFGGLRVQFWVFKGPRPSGNSKNIIWITIFFEKNVFLAFKLFSVFSEFLVWPHSGSKWFKCPKNDKICTLGATERPSGVRNRPILPQTGPQNPSVGPVTAKWLKKRPGPLGGTLEVKNLKLGANWGQKSLGPFLKSYTWAFQWATVERVTPCLARDIQPTNPDEIPHRGPGPKFFILLGQNRQKMLLFFKKTF